MNEENRTDSGTEFGYIQSKCRICGETGVNKKYRAREMMYGTKDEFDYFVCSKCQCMQIEKIPENIGEYYRDGYYSFETEKERKLEGETLFGERILDVGCGAGQLLLDVAAKERRGNLFGCDPFIKKDIRYGDRVYIKKCEIMEMEGEYDFIRFGDSFEHLANPLEVLQCVKKLLKPDGECVITLPVYPNAAFDVFGINWYQLDAPRHFFIHSRKSMEYLCEQTQLKITSVTYDSGTGQFCRSYLYQLGIPYLAQSSEVVDKVFTKADVECFIEDTRKVNEKEYGDHACFLIRHAGWQTAEKGEKG